MNKIKKLGALAMAVVMCFALAVTASAAGYTASFYGMPGSHNNAFFKSVTVEDDNEVYVHLNDPIIVSNVTGHITNVVLNEAAAEAAGYEVEFVTVPKLDADGNPAQNEDGSPAYEDVYIDVVAPEGVGLGQISVPVIVTVAMGGGHQGGNEMSTTLNVTEA